MADRAQEFNPGLFQVGQVRRVVDDTHGVGLGEARPKTMNERIVRRIARRLQRLPQGNYSSLPRGAPLGRPASKDRRLELAMRCTPS
jgi:hypothetical protein